MFDVLILGCNYLLIYLILTLQICKRSIQSIHRFLQYFQFVLKSKFNSISIFPFGIPVSPQCPSSIPQLNWPFCSAQFSSAQFDHSKNWPIFFDSKRNSPISTASNSIQIHLKIAFAQIQRCLHTLFHSLHSLHLRFHIPHFRLQFVSAINAFLQQIVRLIQCFHQCLIWPFMQFKHHFLQFQMFTMNFAHIFGLFQFFTMKFDQLNQFERIKLK